MTRASLRAHKAPARRKPAPRGRPTEYQAVFAERAYKLCMLGMTDAELGEQFGVDERTINRWKLRHIAFCQSLMAGRQLADAEVAIGMHRRAAGYTRTTVKTVVDPKDPDKSIVQTTVEEVIPDLSAAKLWMHNRQGRHGRWQADPDKANAVALGAGVGGGLAAIFASIDGGTRGLTPPPADHDDGD